VKSRGRSAHGYAHLLVGRSARGDDQLQDEGGNDEEEAATGPEVDHGDVRRVFQLRSQSGATEDVRGEAGQRQDQCSGQPRRRRVDWDAERRPGQSDDDDRRQRRRHHVVAGVTLNDQAKIHTRIGTCAGQNNFSLIHALVLIDYVSAFLQSAVERFQLPVPIVWNRARQ